MSKGSGQVSTRGVTVRDSAWAGGRAPGLLGQVQFLAWKQQVYLHFTGCLWRPPRTNVLDTKDRDFLKSCRFGPKNPYCPIFRLGSVVSWTGSNFQEIALKVGEMHSEIPPWGLRAPGLGSVMRRRFVGGPMGWGGPAVTCPRDSLFSELASCICAWTSGTRGGAHSYLLFGF